MCVCVFGVCVCVCVCVFGVLVSVCVCLCVCVCVCVCVRAWSLTASHLQNLIQGELGHGDWLMNVSVFQHCAKPVLQIGRGMG